MPSIALRTLRISAVLGLAGTAFAYAEWGWRAASGFGLGLAVGAVSVVSLDMFGAAVVAGQVPKGQGAYRAVGLWLLLKLPIMGVLTYTAASFGSDSVACFMVAVALVYSVLVSLALRDTKS